MSDTKLEAEVIELRSAVRLISEATHRALSLIEIAHRRDLAHDPGYQDLISEASRFASRARNLLADGARSDGDTHFRETLKPHKYL